MKQFFLISVALIILSYPSLCHAGCDEMNSQEWLDLSAEMAKDYDGGDLDSALNAANQLMTICDQSPIVAFTISEIYRKKNNEEKSYKYVKMASESLQNYKVPTILHEKIWFRRSEFDTPYKKELEALTQSKSQLASDHVLQKSQYEVFQENAIHSAKTYQWVGTGLAIAGGVFIVTGAVLTGVFYNKADDASQKGRLNDDFNTYNQLVHTGAGLLAGGIALGAVGTFLAIYSHFKILEFQNPGEAVATTISMTASPNSLGLNIAF